MFVTKNKSRRYAGKGNTIIATTASIPKGNTPTFNKLPRFLKPKLLDVNSMTSKP
jgi:hypothetical protein